MLRIWAEDLLIVAHSPAIWTTSPSRDTFCPSYTPFTVGDAGKIIKKDNQIEWMRKISKTEQTARDLGLKNRRRLEELQQEGLRASLIAQLPEKDAELKLGMEKLFRKYIEADLVKISEESYESTILLAQNRDTFEKSNDLSDALLEINVKRSRSWLAKVNVTHLHTVQIFKQIDWPSGSYVFQFQDLSSDSWQKGLKYLEERVVEDLYRSID